MLCGAFDAIASEWLETEAAEAPFASGITAHGAPVEFSLKRNSRSVDQEVRFIAQPGHPRVSADDDKAFARDRAVAFALRYAGVEAASFTEGIARFLDFERPLPGNFFIWLGLDLNADLDRVVKVYVNPSAGSVTGGSLGLAETLLRMAQLGSVIPAMRMMDAAGMLTNAHIVGVNLDRAGVREIKVYFPHDRVSLDDLVRTASAFGEPVGLSHAVRRVAPFTARARGQVHTACVWHRGVPSPRFRVSLYCADWFASDLEVSAAVDALMPGLAPVQDEKSPSDTYRQFTFVGVDGDNAVLYSTV